MSKFDGKKTNNARTNAKEILRERLLSKMKASDVLEVFCGSGKMYDKVWERADSYVGIDRKKYWDSRHTVCGDAIKSLEVVDVQKFTIFDIDAYGSPYDVLSRIMQKIGTHQEIGFAITDGSAMDLRMGRVSKGLRELVGIDFHELKKAHIAHDFFVSEVLQSVAKMLNGKVTHFELAKGKTGSKMYYYTFIVRKMASV